MLIRQTYSYSNKTKTIEGTLSEIKEYLIIVFDFTSPERIQEAETLEQLVDILNSSFMFNSSSFYLKFSVAKRASKANVIAKDFIEEHKEQEIARQKEQEKELERAQLLKKVDVVFDSSVVLAQIGTFTEFGGSSFFTPVHTIDPELTTKADLVDFCLAGGYTVMVTTMTVTVETTEGHWDGYGGYEPTESEVSKTIERTFVHF